MLHFWQLPILFATGLVSGFVDSIAGGGGLITLPVLLSLGVDPHHALGTNKLQSTCGSGSAAWHYRQAGLVSFRNCLRGFVCSAIGAAAGTWLVQRMDSAFLKSAIPLLLLLIA